MEKQKIIMVIEKSGDYFDAYSDNCEGIYAAGESIDAVKKNTAEAIDALRRNLPKSRWPRQLRGEYEIEWRVDVPSFLEYYSRYMSLSGMERATGVNQKQLSNYLNHRAVPRRRQADRIMSGIHRFASELMSITV